MAPNGPPIVAENTIFHDAQRPSHVVLPVIPPITMWADDRGRTVCGSVSRPVG